MKLKVVLFVFLMPLFLSAQSSNAEKYQSSNTGIAWVDAANWEQVKSIAKRENKCIFVDCYTTWCGPCKRMDKEVYSKEEVGDFVNKTFISVKLQMDTTPYDDQMTRNWYADARRIGKDYTITAFPTLLFFSPEGKPLHKAIGYKNAEAFVSLSKDALDPSKQYYAILNDYVPGKFDTSELKGLAVAFKKFGNDLSGKMAAEYFSRIAKKQWGLRENIDFMMTLRQLPEVQKIVVEYLTNLSSNEFKKANNVNLIGNFSSLPEVKARVIEYLDKLSFSQLKQKNILVLLSIYKKEEPIQKIANQYIKKLKERELYQKKNIELMTDFVQNTSDRGFRFFYNNMAAIDDTMNKKGYALTMVDFWIDREQISPYWENAINQRRIDWNGIHSSIEKKYSKEFADRIVLNSKVFLFKYLSKKDEKYWGEYLKLAGDQIRKYPPDTTDFWKENYLNEIGWYTFVHTDDKVLLNEAINWMSGVVRRNSKSSPCMDTYANLLYKSGKTKEAIEIEEDASKLSPDSKSLKVTLEKMRNGFPTWQ